MDDFNYNNYDSNRATGSEPAESDNSGASSNTAGTNSTGAAPDPYEYRYVPNSAPEPVYQYSYTAEPAAPKRPKREKKKVNFTRGGVAVLVICCMLIGLASGFGGSYLAKKLSASTGSDNPTVLYQSVHSDGDSSASGGTTADVAAAVSASVVAIVTEQLSIGNGWIQDYVTDGAGSGVIISSDGYIITNEHVVEGARQIKVTTSDGTEYVAQLVGYDADADIAVVKIDATGLQAAVFGDSDQVVVGEDVVAVGNPLGTLGGTVTNGIISATDREITVEGKDMVLLQTNADINPGNSGGGLFNSYGELIGIVNAKSAGENVEGIGFAIPINGARTSAESIIESGGSVSTSTKAALGATVVEILDTTTMQQYNVTRLGVYIGKINAGGAAEKAGLQAGDYIVSFAGKLISENADLTDAINGCSIGDKVELQIIRDEKMLTVTVTLEQFNSGNY